MAYSVKIEWNRNHKKLYMKKIDLLKINTKKITFMQEQVAKHSLEFSKAEIKS